MGIYNLWFDHLSSLLLSLSARKLPDLEFYVSVHAIAKHNQSVDIHEKLVQVVRVLNFSKRLTNATNHTFSVQHACSLSTTPTLLA